MDEYQSLSHTKWDCKYHVIFIPKCRRRTLYEQLRRHLGEVFRRLAVQKESRIEEGYLMPESKSRSTAASRRDAQHSRQLLSAQGQAQGRARPRRGTHGLTNRVGTFR